MSKARPRWERNDTLRRSASTKRLLTKHADVLEPELEEGFVAGFDGDVEALRTGGDAPMLGAQKTATASERELASDAHDLLMIIRALAQRSPKASAALRTALAVGEPLKVTDTNRILELLAVVAAQADALRACGAPAVSIAEAATLAIDLKNADDQQQVKIGERTNTTEDRNDIQVRVEAGVETVSLLGVFLFRKNAAVRGRFERLLSSSGPTKEDVTEDEGGA